MGVKQNLIGQRFGRLIVVEDVGKYSNGSIKWLCQCECGNKTLVRGDILKSGRTKSCGCLSREVAKKHLEGQRFGYLTVVRDAERNKYGDVLWECECDCGNKILTTSVNLTHESVKSCGCMKGKMIREKNLGHGLRNTKLYSVWGGMKHRCNNPNDSHYANYGKRGIKVCKEWNENFVAFYEWSLRNGFQENLTLDRIDNDKGYSPDNCRWITNQDQQRNKQNTIFLAFRGEKKALVEWSEITGINKSTLKARIERGWSIEKALTTPVKTTKKEGSQQTYI